MKLSVRSILAASLLVSAAAMAVAQSGGMQVVQVVPAELKFAQMPNGTFQAPVVGDASKPGPYAIRTRIPAGIKLLPHFHPEDRIVVVLGGTLYFGYGQEFDESKLRPMPPGSVFTEPGKQAHFSWAKDGGVVLHVTGIGPTGTTELAK